MGYRWKNGRLITDKEFEEEAAAELFSVQKLLGFAAVYLAVVIIVAVVGELLGFKILDSAAFNYLLFFAIIPAYIFRVFGIVLFTIGVIIVIIYYLF